MAKFAAAAPLKNWGLGGEFLPKELSDTLDCEVLAVKKNEDKGIASAWIQVDDKTYIVDYMSLNPKKVGGEYVLDSEEITITVENGRIIDAK